MTTSDRLSPTTFDARHDVGAEEHARWSLGRWASDVGRGVVYLIVAFVLATVAFSLVIPLLAAGVGTIVVWVGLPILLAAVMLARGFAATDRALHTHLLGHPMPTPAAKGADSDAGWMRRLVAVLLDPQSWMNALWVLVHFVLATISFPIAIAWTAASIGTIGGPLATLIVNAVLPDENTNGLAELFGMTGPLALGLDVAMQFLVGLIFLLTLAPVIRALTAMHRGVARGLLSSRYEDQQKLARTEESRAAGRQAESTALRRLERDLHDGPQQRLVRAQIDLARAERLGQSDPERARTLMSETRTQLADTLDELRRLSRGIAPPVLVDRGLAAALTELAAICPVPTTVDCPDLGLPDHVETGIYYVVSESLANASKHAHAEKAHVSVTAADSQATVVITDDGNGGAQLMTGHGLAGLAGRVASLEGRFSVDSPAGAGTRVEAVIPCAS